MKAGFPDRVSLATAVILGTVLLLAADSHFLRADSIYYQKGEDGTIRLTNAPSSQGYHTYLSTGAAGGAGELAPGMYADFIRRAASQFDVDPVLVRAVIAAESNFDPRAVSPKGARGLMQLMPSTASRFGVKDVFDPGQNIAGGVRYLRYLLDLFEGDLVLALAAYNAGEGVVQSTGGIPNFPETRDYVDRVLAGYGHPGKASRASSSHAPAEKKTAISAKSRIYKAVGGDGALVYSDSPIPKPVQD
jgi:soluble lytic murein transglycosylase-like protein